MLYGKTCQVATMVSKNWFFFYEHINTRFASKEKFLYFFFVNEKKVFYPSLKAMMFYSSWESFK